LRCDNIFLFQATPLFVEVGEKDRRIRQLNADF